MKKLDLYSSNPKQIIHLKNLTQFVDLFAFYLKTGASNEYYMENRNDFQFLVEQATKIAEQIDFGGNAAVIGLRAHIEGCKVLLGTAINQKFFKESFNEEVIFFKCF